MTAPLPLLTEDEVHAVIKDEVDERRSFGCLRGEQGLLPLKALDVDARIVGTFAHTKLTQTFTNTAGVPVEATYIFPLPDRAAVVRFTMEVAGRRVEGDLQERGQARQTYDRAIQAGKRASIAEEERPGTFSLRVGNLLAGESATIILEMTGPLPVVDGEVTYRFPLVVAPRYIPGRALAGDQVGDGTATDTDAVPDASRISPPVLLRGYPNPVRLGIRVAIDGAGLPLSMVRSALHAAWADEAEGLLQVKIGQGERLDRDFILRFRLGDTAMRTSARATKVAIGDDAFLLTVLPAMVGGSSRARDVVFVVDRSGSMSGWKMIAARRSVARMVDTLRGTDRFCVLAFDDLVDTAPNLGPKLVTASDRHRFQAVEWLATVSDRGGTEMAQPLSMAADLLSSSGLERDRVLVFVTDGQVGNEAQLLKLLGSRLSGTRVFALGIDQAVNAGFLNRLAALGGQGEAELVESEDRVDEVLTRCHRRIDTPALRDLQITIEDGDLVGDSVAPSRLPDVFTGVPAVVVGKLRRRGNTRPTVVVTGVDSAGGRFSTRVPVETSANPSLLPAWGRLRLRDLEDSFDGNRGNRSALQQRIVQVSLETKVLCRFTAFVAVDHEVVNEGGRLHQTTQAVEEPAGQGAQQKDVADVARSRAAMPAPSAAPPSPARSPAPPSPPTGGARAAAPAKASSPVRYEAETSDDDDVRYEAELSDANSLGGMLGSVSLDDSDDSFDSFDSFDEGAADTPSAEPASAPTSAPRMSAPAEQGPAAKGVTLGALINKAREAVFGDDDKTTQPAKRVPTPAAVMATTTTTATTSLAAFVERLAAALQTLQQTGATNVEDVLEALRLIVEEAAHAGVPPAVRKPVDDAIAALVKGDVQAAIALLENLVPADQQSGRRGGTFWGT
jgi:Ca-activated chloride channel family protein